MPSDRDILLEDGTVWDGTDLEEPFLCRRLRLCQKCRSIMATPEQIRKLGRLQGWICHGSEDGTFTCSVRGMAVAGVERWTRRRQEHTRQTGEPPREHELIPNPRKEKYLFGSMNPKSLDIKELRMGTSKTFMTSVDLLDLHVYALPGDPAAEYISTRPLMLDLPNESNGQIHSWITTCRNEHKDCPIPKDAPLPTRLIEVCPGADGSDSVVRVRETRGGVGRYTALSYCWGPDGQGQFVKLFKGTHERMTSAHGIELGSLPLTIQDAIRVTKELGLRFLWVDALCIVQDSLEDMTHELGQMASVYKNSYLTISAASAATCHDGFLHHRTPRRSEFPRFELPYRAWDESEGPPGTVVVQEVTTYYAYQEPINRRAWCLQESLLSPRVVIFGTHELLWQCGKVTDGNPLIAGGPGDSFPQGNERLNPAFFDPARTIRRLDWETSWSDVVMSYSQRETSLQEDKLMALAGLATEHQRLSDGDEYVAGLWRRELAWWLAWIVDPSPSADLIKGVQALQPRPSAYVAPSWSWASVRGVISYASQSCKIFRGELLRYEVSLRNDNLPMGAVTGGLLELRVQLRETRWSGQTLFEDTEADSKPIGKAFMDADEEKPEVVSCLGMYPDDIGSGLMVVRKSPTTYSRVGWFELRGVKCGVEFDDWFAGYDFKTITLV